uniref:Uncharacterized protein n=1 Tax=Arion vulgaris TaxID=1028688 RepID=A0A0B6Z481_9EUPU
MIIEMLEQERNQVFQVFSDQIKFLHRTYNMKRLIHQSLKALGLNNTLLKYQTIKI